MIRFALAVLLIAAPAAAQTGIASRVAAILVQPIGVAHVVPGDDGRDHVAYDLLVTNAFAAPVTLQSVEILGPGGAVLGRLEGADLGIATQTVLTAMPVAEIPASGVAAVEIDLALAPGAVPARLTHRITYVVPEDAPFVAALSGRSVEGAEIAVSAFAAPEILPPLAGPGWATVNGCCSPNIHRALRISDGTALTKSETFAIDWVRVEDGRFFAGDGAANGQYPYRGAEIRSVAAGDVVGTRDGMEESVPNQPVTSVKLPDDYGGNYVIVRIEPDLYAFYAHLEPGSVAVAAGDRVEAGQRLGALGNSGNSTAPHLHFGLLDRPDPLTGTSLPFVFADFEVTGTVTGASPDGTLTIDPATRAVARGYPLAGSIATFR